MRATPKALDLTLNRPNPRGLNRSLNLNDLGTPIAHGE